MEETGDPMGYGHVEGDQLQDGEQGVDWGSDVQYLLDPIEGLLYLVSLEEPDDLHKSYELEDPEGAVVAAVLVDVSLVDIGEQAALENPVEGDRRN